MQQECARPERELDDDYQPHRNLLALVQSIKALSSGIELKDYIRSKRQEIVQRQRSMSQSLSAASDGSGDDALHRQLTAPTETAQLCAATIPEAQQRAVKRARVDGDGDY